MKALHLWFSRKLSCNQISIIFDVVFFTFPGSSVTFVQTQRPATAEILRRTQRFSPSFYYFFSIYLTCFLSLSLHHHFFPYPVLTTITQDGCQLFSNSSFTFRQGINEFLNSCIVRRQKAQIWQIYLAPHQSAPELAQNTSQERISPELYLHYVSHKRLDGGK